MNERYAQPFGRDADADGVPDFTPAPDRATGTPTEARLREALRHSLELAEDRGRSGDLATAYNLLSEAVIEAIRALAAPAPGGLDGTWAEAEAALPSRRGLWLIQGVQLVDTSDSDDLNDERLEWEAEAVDHQRGGQPYNITALGPTPAAALRALAARLAGEETEG